MLVGTCLCEVIMSEILNIKIYTIPYKKRTLLTTKLTKSDIGGGERAKNVMLLTEKFSVLLFSVTQISLLFISWHSDNAIVSNTINKTHSRGYLYV